MKLANYGPKNDFAKEYKDLNKNFYTKTISHLFSSVDYSGVYRNLYQNPILLDDILLKHNNMKDIRDTMKNMIAFDTVRNNASLFVVKIPSPEYLPMALLLPDEIYVVEKALTIYNSCIPKKGFQITLPSNQNKGIFWGLKWEHPNIIASITVVEGDIKEWPPMFMSGIKYIKKPSIILTKLVIERLYIDNNGLNSTIHSII